MASRHSPWGVDYTVALGRILKFLEQVAANAADHIADQPESGVVLAVHAAQP
jgi:hypothetical protein